MSDQLRIAVVIPSYRVKRHILEVIAAIPSLAHGDLNVTNQQSERLVRLPLWVGLSDEQQDRVVEVLRSASG